MTSPKGKQLYEAKIQTLDYLLSVRPTNRSTDSKKIPDLIYCCVIRGIASTNAQVEDCYDLSSVHSPIIITLGSQALTAELPQRLTNKLTKWDLYKNIIEPITPLRTPEDIDAAIENLEHII